MEAVEHKPIVKEQTSLEWVDFICTAYCYEEYHHICNNGDITTTATGTTPTPGKTIAVDPEVIPYGTKVEIKGIGIYTAEDCGGAIENNRMDILVETHKEALEFGVQTLKVRIVN